MNNDRMIDVDILMVTTLHSVATDFSAVGGVFFSRVILFEMKPKLIKLINGTHSL